MSHQQAYQRYNQQAGWTQAARQYVYQQTGLQSARAVLEVGCGEGVITADLSAAGIPAVFGLDRDLNSLLFARQAHALSLYLSCAHANHLPFRRAYFDGVVCHFLLLWLNDPLCALEEMRRVTRPGGWVAVLAEPDYGARIDYPPELAGLGAWQAQALAQQGADPQMGRKLAGLLNRAGLKQVQVGVMGGQWQSRAVGADWEREWTVLENDLGDRMELADLQALKKRDADAWQRGERILYVPTFYGWGQVE